MLDLNPEELKYSESHAWVRVIEDGSYALMGITSYVGNTYGEINYIDMSNILLPDHEAVEIEANDEICSLELVDGNYDFYSPVSGELVTLNEELYDSPKLINTDPYGDGWICKVKLLDSTELEDLMSAEEYKDYLSVLEEE